MSQGEEYEQALQSLTENIDEKIIKGAKKTDESFSSACIYRVPEKLRKLKESAYTPQLVSIGPLHSEDKHLTPTMQDIKMSYVNFLFCRIIGSKEEKFTVLKECVQAMKLLLEDAKKCYNGQVDNLNEEMLVVDGCFILELLYRDNEYVTNENAKQEICDPIFGSRLTRVTVRHDLFLLENQLPFFVLEKLFKIIFERIIPTYTSSHSLIEYVISYFGTMMSFKGEPTTSNGANCCLPRLSKNCRSLSECVLPLFGKTRHSKYIGFEAVPEKSKKVYYYHHMLHILHEDRLPCDPLKGKGGREFMPSASNLDYAGVKFVAGTGQDLFKVKFTEAGNCLKRCFHRACFEIPTLCIYDSTEPFLRNLIAFEQCCPGISCYFTSYAALMDRLVNSEKDVEVLEKAGAIRNYLGAEQEAMDLFNKLCKEVVLGEFFFAETCKQATKYSERCWPAVLAHVRSQYLATPWTFTAFCVAFIVFGITVANFFRLILK